jgi:hypothetical protein
MSVNKDHVTSINHEEYEGGEKTRSLARSPNVSHVTTAVTYPGSHPRSKEGYANGERSGRVTGREKMIRGIDTIPVGGRHPQIGQQVLGGEPIRRRDGEQSKE